MYSPLFHRRAVIAATLALGFIPVAGELMQADPAQAAAHACAGDNGGLTLLPGFCASVFADQIGHARHMAVAPDGTVYVNTWSGRYYGGDTPPAGGMLVALQDTT